MSAAISIKEETEKLAGKFGLEFIEMETDENGLSITNCPNRKVYGPVINSVPFGVVRVGSRKCTLCECYRGGLHFKSTVSSEGVFCGFKAPCETLGG